MPIQLELWHLITLLLAFFACIGGFGKLLLSIYTKGLDERFQSQKDAFDQRLELQEQSRQESREEWHDEFEKLEERIRGITERMPNEYVRREDWIRFSATIDAKLDTLHRKLDTMVEKVYARG